MQFRIKILTLATLLSVSAVQVMAQKQLPEIEKNRHAVSISFSDGSTLGGASFWGMGLSDAITGTQRSDATSTGVYGLGYRYTVKRWLKLGTDVGFSKVSSKITLSGDATPSIKEKELNFMVLPTADFVYFSRNLFQVYGSAAVGIDLVRHSENGMTERGNSQAAKKSTFSTDFAYQVNPLGVRVGNRKISGYLEAGLGYRGFVTAGISLGF